MSLREVTRGTQWKTLFVLWIWVKLLNEWGRVVTLERGEVTAVDKLVTAYEKVKGCSVTVENMDVVEQDMRRFIEWIVIDCGKSLYSAYRYVIDYFQEQKEDVVVREFIEAYQDYVKRKFGMDIVLSKTSIDVQKAAVVTKKVAEKHGISVYDVIKYQHEFWEEGIRTPFTPKALGREEKVEERLQKYFALRKGEVIKESVGYKQESQNIDEIPGVVFVKKRWKEIQQLGPAKFLMVARGGFLVDICKQFLKDLSSATTDEQKRQIIQKYNVDYVARLWVENGRPLMMY